MIICKLTFYLTSESTEACWVSLALKTFDIFPIIPSAACLLMDDLKARLETCLSFYGSRKMSQNAVVLTAEFLSCIQNKVLKQVRLSDLVRNVL